MATAVNTQNIVALTSVMFNAAPGAANLAEFSNYSDLETLATNLAATDAFNSQFPEGSSIEEDIGIALGFLGLEEGTEAYTEAFNFFEARLSNGTNPGLVMLEAGAYLLGDNVDPKFQEAAQLLQNKVAVGTYYSTEAELSGDVDQLKGAYDLVTAEESSVQAAKDAIDAADTSGLTEALASLQAANADVAAAVEAMNTGLGEEGAPEDYSADAEGVEEARADVQEAFNAIEQARDNLVEETVGDLADGTDLELGVSKHLGTAAELTEENLNTALAGVQAEIDADETLLEADGSATDPATTLYSVTDLSGETAYVTAANTGTQQTVDIELSDTLTDAVINFALNNDDVSVTLDNAGTAVASSTLPEGYSAAIDNGTLTITGPEDTAYTLSDVASDTATVDASAIVTYYAAEDAEPAGYVADVASLTDGVLDSEDDLLELVTLADLQQEMLDAEQALADARNTNSDAELLDAVRTEINDYLGAGGDDVDANADADADLLGLRTAITAELDKDEVSLSNTVDVESNDLLVALAGSANLAGNDLTDGEAVSTPATEAPSNFAGQGEWVQGDVVDEQAGTYEWIYQPTAEEQSLIDALADVETREQLITAESTTETNFETATNDDGEDLGGQLLAIEDRLETLGEAEQAVVDAQAELDDANTLIDGLESALSDLDTAEQWFTDNDYALPETVDGAESGTDTGDIFVFAESEGEAFTISSFGEEGRDTLYFGEGYTVTELGADEEITDRVGSVDTLEIFTKQNGDDLQLFVEADAAAGFDRGDIATEQMTKITLENFSAEDIASFDGQSLIAGVATQETVEVA